MWIWSHGIPSRIKASNLLPKIMPTIILLIRTVSFVPLYKGVLVISYLNDLYKEVEGCNQPTTPLKKEEDKNLYKDGGPNQNFTN